MAVGATRGGETTARKRKHQSGDAVDARARSAPVAFPRLPFDVVVTHVLRETNFPDPADLAVLRAVSRGMRDAVDASLAATGRELCELDDEAATTRGVLSAVTRLKRRGLLKSDVWLSYAAARSGALEKLKMFREVGFPWETRTCAFAAMGGHLEVLEWLRENKCPWDGDTCSNAAEEGHLNVLRWARENGCPWDTRTCSYAARNGHLETLQWARANGCPWDDETYAWAARGGHLDILNRARESGCP